MRYNSIVISALVLQSCLAFQLHQPRPLFRLSRPVTIDKLSFNHGSISKPSSWLRTKNLEDEIDVRIKPPEVNGEVQASERAKEHNALESQDVSQSHQNNTIIIGGEATDATPEQKLTTAAATTTRNSGNGYDIRRFRCASYLLIQAAGIGIVSGWSVGIFKILADTVHNIAYAGTANANRLLRLFWLPLIPTVGGLIVALLSKLGGGFPPGMRDTIKSVDQWKNDSSTSSSNTAYHPIFHQFRFIKKSLAAIVTLGTGCSLGPEGPSVEIGMNLSRLTMDIFPSRITDNNSDNPLEQEKHQKRLLLACGAAAGVSAGFNAPIAGAFFALEIMQQAFHSIDQEKGSPKDLAGPGMSTSSSVSAILLASVTSALVCQSLLGEHLMLALKDYSIRTPLLELPIFLLLGATSGLAAYLFGQASSASRSLFQGRLGPSWLRNRFAKLPTMAKPAMGGLFCGLVGLVFPQILFSGYDTVNIALANRMLPTLLLVTLLGVKMLTTAVAAGSGLVGGTFAPSLFLGGMVGASFHNVVSWLLESAAHHGTITLASPMLQMADLPAYTMVGAAAVLAAVFRAPLTASLLLFELTRDYAAILPLMASSGVASVVGDILDVKRETRVFNKQSAAALSEGS